jgi:hypothetical protein
VVTELAEARRWLAALRGPGLRIYAPADPSLRPHMPVRDSGCPASPRALRLAAPSRSFTPVSPHPCLSVTAASAHLQKFKINKGGHTCIHMGGRPYRYLCEARDYGAVDVHGSGSAVGSGRRTSHNYRLSRKASSGSLGR